MATFTFFHLPAFLFCIFLLYYFVHAFFLLSFVCQGRDGESNSRVLPPRPLFWFDFFFPFRPSRTIGATPLSPAFSPPVFSSFSKGVSILFPTELVSSATLSNPCSLAALRFLDAQRVIGFLDSRRGYPPFFLPGFFPLKGVFFFLLDFFRFFLSP